jgi:hypothetical protein
MTSIIEKIRIKIGEYLLKRKLEKRERQIVFHNLKNIKTTGIVFEALPTENITHVKSFIAELKKYGIETKALGYAHEHRKHLDLIGGSTINYVSKDDFNFFYESKDKVIDEFVSKKFRLLIVYCENDYFPLKYISSLSLAEMKAGEQGVCDENLDFMIQLTERKGLYELQKQLIRYLSTINQK